MSVKFETVKAGDILYDVHRERMGNTRMSRSAVLKVAVIEVGANYAMCSWNGNPARRCLPYQVSRLRRSMPKKLNGHLLGCRRYAGPFSGDCTCDAIKGEPK
jgi:hypothetical protein